MLQLKLSALLSLTLAILVCPAVWAQANADCDDDDANRDVVDDVGLCRSFQGLRSTIEETKLLQMIKVYNQCDVRFRRAMRFVNTTRFRLVANQLEQTRAYNTILQDLRAAGVDTTDINRVVDIFSCLVLPVPQAAVECDCAAVRGHNFIDDMVMRLPHDKVHSYNIRSNSTNYAKFVRVVTSPRFQTRLQQLMRDPEVVRPLRLMRANQWDIPRLLRAMTTILSW